MSNKGCGCVQCMSLRDGFSTSTVFASIIFIGTQRWFVKIVLRVMYLHYSVLGQESFPHKKLSKIKSMHICLCLVLVGRKCRVDRSKLDVGVDDRCIRMCCLDLGWQAGLRVTSTTRYTRLARVGIAGEVAVEPVH